MQPLLPINYLFEPSVLLLSMYLEYLAFTGIIYLFFYVWNHKKYWAYKIQHNYRAKKHIIRDIKYSFFTIVIFGLVIIPLFWASKHGYTRIYHPIDKYGYVYYIFSIVLMVFVHDAYFYWTHRFLHWKPMFKYIHKVHHLTLDPTPFSAYAFHPVEALIEVGIIPLIAFTIPHHGSAITLFTLYQLFTNVVGHLGFEFFPSGFTKHKVFKWANTATHHNMHHRFIKCNYGLYMNIWDKVMKTNHRLYDETFERVVAQRAAAKTETEPETAMAESL